ncbi:MAG: hypothetical protein ACF8PN_09740 [Phycisphaerales bacterium]
MRFLNASVIVSASLTVVASAANAQLYQSEAVGTLGGDDTTPSVINNLGVVSGVSQTADGQFVAFIKTPDKALMALDDANWASVHGMNDLNEVVGVGDNMPLYWNGSETTTLAIPGTHLSGIAFDINNAGVAVGHSRYVIDNFSYTAALKWDGGVPIELPSLGGSNSAVAINELGDIVGSSYDSGGDLHSVLWPATGGIIQLADLDHAHDVNNAREVAGWVFNGEGGRTAAVWAGGVVTELGYIAAPRQGAPISEAVAIADDGCVGGWSTTRDDYIHAVAWENGFLIDADELFVGPGYLSNAIDMNNARQLLVRGNWNGNDDGFILTPIVHPLSLAPPTPGRAGESNELVVTGATPNARIYFAYSQRSAATSVQGCVDLFAALRNPTIAGAVRANASGEARVSGFVPIAAQGAIFGFQAVDPAACVMSNLATVRFE